MFVGTGVFDSVMDRLLGDEIEVCRCHVVGD